MQIPAKSDLFTVPPSADPILSTKSLFVFIGFSGKVDISKTIPAASKGRESLKHSHQLLDSLRGKGNVY